MPEYKELRLVAICMYICKLYESELQYASSVKNFSSERTWKSHDFHVLLLIL